MRPTRTRWRHAITLVLAVTAAQAAGQTTPRAASEAVPASTTAAPATVDMPVGRWALTTQTLLPHLEEALRYATTRDERCLAAPAADDLFPVLKHDAFAGCALVGTAQPNVFALRCRNAQAASGQARVEASPTTLDAVLDLKMGGKNMTLAQRVTGRRVGACP